MRRLVGKWPAVGIACLAMLSTAETVAGARNSAFDERGDVEGSGAADLRRLSVIGRDGGLDLSLLTAGLLEDGRPVEYRIAIGSENQPGPESAVRPFDLFLIARAETAPPRCGQIGLPVLLGRPGPATERDGEAAGSVAFAETSDIQAIYKTACMVSSVLDRETGQYREARVPSAQSLSLVIPGGNLPAGPLRIQVAATDLTTRSTDVVPNDTEVFSYERR